MPKIMAEADVSPLCKRAFVVRSLAAETEFLQELADRSDHKLRVFTDIDKATAWLLAGEKYAME